ncbi:mastigoneme protein [Aureococcus anophagefferens]|nr:mastigoneme protein [Aureococcus anophagefferens]
MQGCLCDSDWAVGLGDGETQVAEYFGADCSRRRCPSGRDPSSKADGTDCSNVTTPEGYGVGSKHNKCHYGAAAGATATTAGAPAPASPATPARPYRPSATPPSSAKGAVGLPEGARGDAGAGL